MDVPALRNHLRKYLDREQLLQLVQYNQAQLLNDLDYLLNCPLFLHTMRPRLKDRNPDNEHTNEPMTPQSLEDEACNINDSIDITKLNIMFVWENNSWATQLRYEKSVLIEGRQLNVALGDSFAQSFHWFCDEVEFLWYEFRARETLSTQRGEDGDKLIEAPRPGKKQSLVVKLRTGQVGKKRRRLTKLKIRLQPGDGRPVLATRRK